MALVQGTPIRDVLVGTGDPDTINGGAGDDDLIGLAGDDNLNGGDGDDHLYGGAGQDRLDGGLGHDYAHYNEAASGLYLDLALPGQNTGEAAGDTYFGIEGLVGSAFGDTISGDDARNFLYGFHGNDALFGRGGADALLGGNGDDELVGGAGSDALYGEAGNDHLYPGVDSDYLVSGGGQHLLNGGDGFDFARYDNIGRGVYVDLTNQSPMTGATGVVTGDFFVNIEGVVGTNFNDTLRGSATANWLYGYAGDDLLDGNSGDDVLIGGMGQDTLQGGTGNDWLWGEDGDDNLLGGDFHDVLIGGAGNDTLQDDYGNDVLHGNNGDDVFRGNPFSNTGLETDFYYGGAGIDTVDYTFTQELNNTIDLVLFSENRGVAARDSYNSIENVVGTAFFDNIRGDSGPNSLDGNDRRDTIYGRGGDDLLIGGNGNDVLFGNAGNDILIGNGENSPLGDDQDGFYFEVGDGSDTIRDFQAGTGLTDVLYLSTALGVSSFAEAMARATQTLEGVLFNFAGGETVLLNGIQTSQLVSDDFGFF